MTKTNNKLFLYISALILLVDLIFVGINYNSSKKTFDLNIKNNLINVESFFQLGLSDSYSSLEQMAILISENELISSEFLKASKSQLVSEQAKSREIILNALKPSWERLTDKYSVRQLHFHFAPGATSFLRVHQPEKFGDNMDDLRHIIVDTNRDKKPRTGFELGRVYSGLRATIPVFGINQDNGKKEFAGTLEVGTSYQKVLQDSFKSFGYEVAILLSKNVVEKKVWSLKKAGSIYESRFPNCFVEAATSQLVLDVIPSCKEISGEIIIEKEGKSYSISRKPLFDYNGLKIDNPKSIGSIFVLKDITELQENLNYNNKILFLFALFSYLFIEVLLFFGFASVSKVLNKIIKSKTEKLETLKEHYKALSTVDGLTGLKNRSYFMKRLAEEQSRSKRENSPLSVIMLDIDHFKKVNDDYGHLVGDHAIVAVANEIKGCLRDIDIDGRYGGEEFCVVLPNTKIEDAKNVAERLRKNIEKCDILNNDNDVIHIAASFGVSLWNKTDDNIEFIDKADHNLYFSKENGRNRVTVDS